MTFMSQYFRATVEKLKLLPFPAVTLVVVFCLETQLSQLPPLCGQGTSKFIIKAHSLQRLATSCSMGFLEITF